MQGTNFLGKAMLVGLMLLPSAAVAFNVPSGRYELDTTHAYITVSYNHLGFSTPEIGFNSFSVDLQADADNPEQSSLRVVVDAASVDSRVAEFDEHLNGEDFFQTEQYPEIRFTSTRVKQTGEDTFTVYGNLTIKGTTKAVTLRATINKAANHPMLKKPAIGISAEGRVQRTDFDLGYGVPLVSDFVDLNIQVEMMLVEGEQGG